MDQPYRANLIRGQDFIGAGVGAAVVDRHQILLLKRLKPPEAGCWGIAGGAIEWGESIEAALRRELREELAIDVEILSLLGVCDHILPEEQQHWVSPVFLVTIAAGEPQNCEAHKHSDLAWFSLDALPSPLTLTAQTAIALLKNR